jgi:hypothetical protein
MSLPDRDSDPMIMLHRASGEEPVPAETRARVWAGVARALPASAAGISEASSRAASDRSSAGANAGDGDPGVVASAGEGLLRPWLSKFLHWSAPALVIGAAAGVTARNALIPAELPAIGARSGVTEPKALPSAAPASSAAATELPAPAIVDKPAAPAVVPSAESSANPRLINGTRELARERAILDQARARIAAGEPVRALDFVERHERRYPQGALSEEREALAVNALVSIGRYREAAQRGEAFRTRYPQSLLTPSVEAALAAIPEP